MKLALRTRLMDYSPSIIKKVSSIPSVYEYKHRSYHIQTSVGEGADKLRYTSKQIKLNRFGAAAQLQITKAVAEEAAT